MKQVNILKGVVVVYAMVTAAALKNLGCYKNTATMVLTDTSIYQSSGRCANDICKSSAAFATIDHDCYCGDMIPADVDKVDMSKCNINCPGWPTERCGGMGNYTMIYESGRFASVPKAKSAGASKPEQEETPVPSETSSAGPSQVTLPGQTVVVTAPSKATTSAAAPPSSGSKPSTAGIAAGVVVGIIAIAAIAGGLFLFMRNRKRRAIEEEHRRNAAVNSFVTGGKSPHSSGGGSSFTDTRLDPVMAQRRMSDGSIADNQDYSRRILKVTNA